MLKKYFLIFSIIFISANCWSSEVEIVYVAPNEEVCIFVGELKKFSIELLLNERQYKTNKKIKYESTLSYKANEMKGNLVYIRSVELSEGQSPPEAYKNRLIRASHGNDSYFLNPKVYRCAKNS